jgi:MoxR-like ATPase
VHEDLQRYVVALTRATRHAPDVKLGASPRATLALFRAAQTWAAMHGRDFVQPDDVQRLAVPVLAHRLVVSIESRLRERDAAAVVESLVHSVPVPVEKNA